MLGPFGTGEVAKCANKFVVCIVSRHGCFVSRAYWSHRMIDDSDRFDESVDGPKCATNNVYFAFPVHVVPERTRVS